MRVEKASAADLKAANDKLMSVLIRASFYVQGLIHAHERDPGLRLYYEKHAAALQAEIEDAAGISAKAIQAMKAGIEAKIGAKINV